MISKAQLDSFLGKTISEICLNKFHDNSANHCAHFVSHVLNLNFGFDCKAFKGGDQSGANIRVHEIFDQCPSTSEINQSNSQTPGIIFISKSSNFVTSEAKTTLRNVPKKHVGILLGKLVWHYSNGQNKVVSQSMGQFLNHYSGQTNSLWLGSWPPGARAISFGEG